MPDILLGGAPMLGRRYGNKEIAKVMLEDSQIWPPVQKVIYVGSTVTNGTGVTLSAHVAGDLLVVAAQGGGTTSTPVPALPAGWTQAYRSSSNQGCPVLIGYKFATASNTQGGTWANSAYTCGYVFRGADTTTPFGAFNSTMNAASTPAVTPVNTAGESVLVHYFYNNGTTGAWGASPVGLLGKNAVARLGNLQRLDTRIGAGAKWSHTASPVPNFRTVQFEVLPPAAAAPSAPPYLYDVQVEYLPNYEVKFTVLDGWEPTAGDYYFFTCAEISRDGPVGRVFNKTFVANAYNGLNCTLEDRSGIPGKEMKTISFKIYPKG